MNIVFRIFRSFGIVIYIFYILIVKHWVKCIVCKYGRNRGQALWSNDVADFFGIKRVKLEGSVPASKRRTLFLLNHRSHADFFLHDIVTDYDSNFLSRMAVAIIFPLFYVFPQNTVWFFIRDKKIVPEKFNAWLDSQFTKTPRQSLIVYPEAHRMYGAKEPAELKTGLIKYAHMRGHLIQIGMCFGGQNVINEKKLEFNFGKTVYYKLDNIIDPKDFPDIKVFVNTVTDRFKEFFRDTYRQLPADWDKEKVE